MLCGVFDAVCVCVLFLTLCIFVLPVTPRVCAVVPVGPQYELSGGFIKNAMLSALLASVARTGTNPVISEEDIVFGCCNQVGAPVCVPVCVCWCGFCVRVSACLFPH